MDQIVRKLDGVAAGVANGDGLVALLRLAGERPADPHRHVDGVPWYEAPLPRRFHRCRPQTSGRAGHFDFVDRCACGAIRWNARYWLERNSRLRTDR
jgi:hypothetical protein